MALSHVSGMASHDAIFIAKKRLEYFFKCNILGYPTEAVEGDGSQYASLNPQNVEMPHGAFQLLRIKNRCANDFPAFALPLTLTGILAAFPSAVHPAVTATSTSNSRLDSGRTALHGEFILSVFCHTF